MLVQFHHLQNVVNLTLKEEEKPLYPLDLLKALTTFQDTKKTLLGEFIHSKYSKALAEKPSAEGRLTRALNGGTAYFVDSFIYYDNNFDSLLKHKEIQSRAHYLKKLSLNHLPNLRD